MVTKNLSTTRIPTEMKQKVWHKIFYHQDFLI